MSDSKTPCWLVWEAAGDGGRPYLIAADTSAKQAALHVRRRREEARLLDKPPPILRVETSWLDHLYGESMTKDFDEAKHLMRAFLSTQVADLRRRLACAIALAREAVERGWQADQMRERLVAIDDLATILPPPPEMR